MTLILASVTTQEEVANVKPEPDGLMHILHIIGKFYEDGIDDHLAVFALLVVIIIDILLGFSHAWAQHNYSSSKFRKGLVSHIAMFLITALAYPLCVFAGLGVAVDAFIISMLFAYGSSVLANLSALGVRIPYIDKFIRQNIDADKFDVDKADYTNNDEEKKDETN